MCHIKNIVLIKKLFLFLLFLFVVKIHSQQIKPTVLKSTITSVGSTSIYPISINNKKYEIQQSIGQSSIIGTRRISKTSVQQGFLNNIKYYIIDNTNTDIIDETLDLVISPNPFIDHIKINFSRKTKHDIHVIIYDINGKVLFSKINNPTDNLFVPMSHFSIGGYIIRIQSGKNKFAKKLLKTK